MSRRFSSMSARWGLSLCLSLSLLAGCDPAGTASSSPSPLDVPKSVLDLPATQKTTKLVFIGTGAENVTQAMWEESALVIAGKAQVMLELVKPRPGDPPGTQAELVRQAMTHGASGLLVVAKDPKSIAPALEEAREKGVSVVLLEHQVPVQGKPLTLVTRPPVDDITQQLVQAAVAEAKAVGQPADGPAIILSSSRDDERKAERIAALKKAIEAAGIHLAEVVTFSTSSATSEEGSKAVEAAVTRHGSIAMIFCADQAAISAASQAREKLESKGDYVLVGLSIDPSAPKSIELSDPAAVVYLNAYGVAREAVNAAIRLVQGDTAPEQIDVKYQLARSPRPRARGGAVFKRDVPR